MDNLYLWGDSCHIFGWIQKQWSTIIDFIVQNNVEIKLFIEVMIVIKQSKSSLFKALSEVWTNSAQVYNQEIVIIPFVSNGEMDYKEPVTCLKYHSSQLGIFWIIFAKPTTLWWDKKEFKKTNILGLESQNTNVVLDAGKFLVQYDNLLGKCYHWQTWFRSSSYLTWMLYYSMLGVQWHWMCSWTKCLRDMPWLLQPGL